MVRTFTADRGFLVIAQNNSKHDYVRMAYALAMSLRATQKEVSRLSVAITPGTRVEEKYLWAFDSVIEIPWGDMAQDEDWKIHNKWKYFHFTPYKETIVLDADMLFFSDIGPWWDHLSRSDITFCTEPRTYRNHPADMSFYRKTFEANRLPNIFTALMYFKQTDLALEVFTEVERVFKNWEDYSLDFLKEHRPSGISGDVAFAIALRSLGVEDLCTNNQTRFVHMKTRAQGWNENLGEDWTNHIPVYFRSDLGCKIGPYEQFLPLHYHDKNFLTDRIVSLYERALG